MFCVQEKGINPKAEVCVLEEPLDGLEISIRAQQTNLGAAIATAMYQCYPKLDACIFNGGSVRIDDKLKGRITEYDILRTLPFGGSVWKVGMKGDLLKKLLDAGLSNKGSGGYLQWHKIEQQEGKWIVGGQPLEGERVYHIAISDF